MAYRGWAPVWGGNHIQERPSARMAYTPTVRRTVLEDRPYTAWCSRGPRSPLGGECCQRPAADREPLPDALLPPVRAFVALLAERVEAGSLLPWQPPTGDEPRWWGAILNSAEIRSPRVIGGYLAASMDFEVPRGAAGARTRHGLIANTGRFGENPAHMRARPYPTRLSELAALLFYRWRE
jgi:hypothetical protein